MAAVAPSADQATDLLQKLSLDSQAKTFDVSDATKKASVDSGKVTAGVQSERSVTPLLSDFMDPPVCYVPNSYASPGYYYSGYDGSSNEWDEYTKYISSDGSEITPGVYGDSRSLMYHGYGYAPYGPYSPAGSPVPTVSHDQLYGAQHYQYATPYFQSITPCGSYPTMSTTGKGEIAAAAPADQVSLSTDSTNSKTNGMFKSGNAKGVPTSFYQDPRFGFDGYQSPIPWLESPYYSDGQLRPIPGSSMVASIPNGNGVPASRNHSIRPFQMGSHNPRTMSNTNPSYGYMNRMYPSKLYGQYDNAYRSGTSHGSKGYDSRTNGHNWMTVDGKYNPRGRTAGFHGYVSESMDGLNEMNRGPRAKSLKNQKGFTPAALIMKGQSIPFTGTTDSCKQKLSVCPDREQYNRPDFPETYADAKFFIIKSYSEDDVHKSIKYNIWTSTPNGNKKLDDAYLDAQTKSGGCPVFLLFSVNTSGQFIGAAEMAGPVDFNKSVEYWQQDKWIGCFPVKWHIVKDVPNSLLKHITLENNENKPVTNSRDTQEVKLGQGLQMLKIFKDHTCKQCILDDFEFYEDRQKSIQEKKAKQQHFQKQLQAKVWDEKATEEKIKENTNGDVLSHKLSEFAPDSDKQPNNPGIQTIGEDQILENNAASISEEVVKSIKSASAIPEKHVSNVDANDC